MALSRVFLNPPRMDAARSEPGSRETLRREVQEGFAQIERGEYEASDEKSIRNLVSDIESRGKKRLAAKRQSRAV
jgi:hypothetical protein